MFIDFYLTHITSCFTLEQFDLYSANFEVLENMIFNGSLIKFHDFWDPKFEFLEAATAADFC